MHAMRRSDDPPGATPQLMVPAYCSEVSMSCQSSDLRAMQGWICHQQQFVTHSECADGNGECRPIGLVPR